MISRLFINRPRLAAVVSLLFVIAGLIALKNIPVAQYPSITPPEIRVTAVYPGASAEVLADTVASVIEKEVNGVDKMLYMSSTCSNTGLYSLAVTFEVGTDPDIDLVNLQNRVQLATPKLPQEVVSQGIQVRKRSSDIMAFVAFYSPDKSRDMLFLSNFVSNEVKDTLVRLKGISDVFIFGEKEYAVRVWMDPSRLNAMGLSVDDVIAAIRSQNVQAAVGAVGQEPLTEPQQVQFTLRAKGRLTTVEEFRKIIIRSNDAGGLVRLGDIATVELAAKSYGHTDMFNGRQAAIMALYRSSGANAIEAMTEVRDELEKVRNAMPAGVQDVMLLDTTQYVSAAIDEIIFTLVLTSLLVILVVYIFLQDWRATLVPAAAIPVSLIGTFAVLLALGYSANTISLFALIMAIGLVVDDAIVVVENVHRVMHEEGLDPKEAAVRAMQQVTGPVIATTLVLLAVFVPVGFMPGITGQLYRQFAVTICTAVLISSLCALSLSPAMCATLLRKPQLKTRGIFGLFNAFLEKARNGYVRGSSILIRRLALAAIALLVVYGTSIFLFQKSPLSFLPQEDQGYFFMNVQLPEAATLSRTTEVLNRITGDIKSIDGVKDVIGVAGFSLLAGDADNVGFAVAILKPWDERKAASQQLEPIVGKAQGRLAAISDANAFAFAPPPILGLGSSGGFDLQLQAKAGQSPQELFGVALSLMMAANQDPRLTRVFTTYTANTPQLFVDIDRDKAQNMGVPVSRIFSTLQAQLGSSYVNDFNLNGRTYQVKVQAREEDRNASDDIEKLYVRSDSGGLIPLRSLVRIQTVLGPQLVKRYNQFAAASFSGQGVPGVSSSEAMGIMEGLVEKIVPKGFGYDWSAMSFQEKKAGGQVLGLFALALIFAYLFLVGQYESWNVPLAVIASVPIGSLGALAGLYFFGMPLSIYAQIGLVLLVGLAAKNAILIVEFARERFLAGVNSADAAVEGARIRFRPVLMTAFTFILGVLPMVLASGAGAGSRRAIGTAVFSGMVFSTLFGIFLIPVLYYLFQRLSEKGGGWRQRRRQKTLVDHESHSGSDGP